MLRGGSHGVDVFLEIGIGLHVRAGQHLALDHSLERLLLENLARQTNAANGRVDVCLRAVEVEPDLRLVGGVRRQDGKADVVGHAVSPAIQVSGCGGREVVGGQQGDAFDPGAVHQAASSWLSSAKASVSRRASISV